MVGVFHEDGREGHVVVQERWKTPPERIELDFLPEQRYEVKMPGAHPDLLCLNVKVSPSQFKVLKQCGQFEARLINSDGSVRPFELQSCRLAKHDQGRGHWTFITWVTRLPDPGSTVRLQMIPGGAMPRGGDS